MKLWQILIPIFFCFTIVLNGQTASRYAGGANVFSRAGITGMQKGIQAIYHNPAAIAAPDVHSSMGFDVSADRRYVNNFFNTSLGGFIQSGKSYFSVGLGQYGISEYKEQNIFLSYSRPILSKTTIGTRFNYTRINIKDYGASAITSVDLGCFSQITKTVSVSFFIDDIATVNKNEALIKDTRLVTAFMYAPSNKVLLGFEVEKTESDDLSPKFGISYKPTDKIMIHSGADLQRSMFGLGFTFSFSGFKVGAAQAYHQPLGGIYAFSINGSN